MNKRKIIENESTLSEKDQFFRSQGYDRMRERSRILTARPYGTILDAGTGNGLSVLQLSTLADVDVISVDQSDDALTAGMSILEQTGKGILEGSGKEGVIGTGTSPMGITFVKADLTNLPFPDDHFDCAISANTLHHIHEWRKAVDELIRATKDLLVIQEFSEEGKHLIDRLMTEWDGELRHSHVKDEVNIQAIATYVQSKGSCEVRPGNVTDLLIVNLHQ